MLWTQTIQGQKLTSFCLKIWKYKQNFGELPANPSLNKIYELPLEMNTLVTEHTDHQRPTHPYVQMHRPAFTWDFTLLLKFHIHIWFLFNSQSLPLNFNPRAMAKGKWSGTEMKRVSSFRKTLRKKEETLEHTDADSVVYRYNVFHLLFTPFFPFLSFLYCSFSLVITPWSTFQASGTRHWSSFSKQSETNSLSSIKYQIL